LPLGIAYTFGKGVLKDYKQAVYWYQKVADQGDAEAQSILGVMYANGKTAIFSGSTSEVMSCPKLKIGFVSPLN
jgi:TPR repeat protein